MVADLHLEGFVDNVLEDGMISDSASSYLVQVPILPKTTKNQTEAILQLIIFTVILLIASLHSIAMNIMNNENAH